MLILIGGIFILLIVVVGYVLWFVSCLEEDP